MIRNGQIHLEAIGQRPQEAFSLPERQVEDHADRQSRLDREIRVDALPAGFATRWRTPGFDGVLRQPDGQVTAAPEACLVCRPVADPVGRFGVLVTGCVSDTSRLAAPDRGQAENGAPNRRSGAMHQRLSGEPDLAPSGGADGTLTLHVEAPSAPQSPSDRHIAVRAGHTRLGPRDSATESLGTQFMEGVLAEGTQTTMTIPTGQIGNDRPIEIVSERWYSPDLQVLVMSRQSDPRFGDTTYRLTNIVRSEPRFTLFEVPEDFEVIEGPGQSAVYRNLRAR